jgi:prepilin-type processing-associated H-X9-DG protein
MILAGLLYPVFASTRSSAKRAACLSNFKQAQLALFLYASDYEDRLVIVNHRPGAPGTSRNDRTWVQLILPYLRSFSVFKCPGDYGDRPAPEATFDQDLVPGDADTRYFSASMRTNLGYNYVYLAPVVKPGSGPWLGLSKHMGEISDVSRTILFVDSVWEVSASGQPSGGGSWLVLPPCRYIHSGTQTIDSFKPSEVSGSNYRIYTPKNIFGWSRSMGTWKHYGFTWPWHTGTMNVIFADGSVRNLKPTQLAAGCDLQPNWWGRIFDSAAYLWDIY